MDLGKRFDLLFCFGIPFLSTFTFASSAGQPVLLLLHANTAIAKKKIQKNFIDFIFIYLKNIEKPNNNGAFHKLNIFFGSNIERK
jgi:hypothetical protein